MRRLATGIVALSGIAIGLLIGWGVRGASSAPDLDEPRGAQRMDREGSAAASAPRIESTSREERPLAAVREEDPVPRKGDGFDVELARRGRAGIESGWSQLRRDAIPKTMLDAAVTGFTDEVARRPEEIGRKLAEEQTKREEAASSGSTSIRCSGRSNRGRKPCRPTSRSPATASMRRCW